MQKSEIKPSVRHRIYDLVREAGVDVSDWSNFRGGAERAASNPRYCYNWSFVEPGKVVVVTLWYQEIEQVGDSLVRRLDLHSLDHTQNTNWIKRSKDLADAIETAIRDAVPIRAVICDGTIKDLDDPEADASSVKLRFLDPLPWSVSFHDTSAGKYTLTRGPAVIPIVDQFSVNEAFPETPQRREVMAYVFDRSADVRSRVLTRSKGKCEYCGEEGFQTPTGIYLETHHVISLAGGGPDTDANVVALCPNHHRQAHHGAIRDEMQSKLQEIARSRIS
jgi:5-methylcytosine-specific restriction enzyme A